MSDATADILIQIRTAFETGGADAASQKVKELTEATKNASTAAVSHTGETNKQARELQLLNAALSGNLGALARTITQVSQGNQAFAAFAKLLPVIGAGIAGWNTGLQVQDFLWKHIVDSVKALPAPVAKTKEEFESLNKVKLDVIKGEIDGLIKKMETANTKLNGLKQMSGEEGDAQEAFDIAKIQAEMPEGPERDKKIAALKVSNAEKKADLAIATSKTNMGTALSTVSEATARKAKLENELKEAEDYYNRAADRANEFAPGTMTEGVTLTLKQARNQRDAARATYGKELPGIQQTIDKAQGVASAEESNIIIAERRKGTAGYQYQSAITAANQKERDLEQEAKLKKDQEADRALKDLADQDLAAIEEGAERKLRPLREKKDRLESSLQENEIRSSGMKEAGLLSSGAVGDRIELKRALQATEDAIRDIVTSQENQTRIIRNSQKYNPASGGNI